MPVVKQSVRKGEMTAPVIGEKMVRAGAEPLGTSSEKAC